MQIYMGQQEPHHITKIDILLYLFTTQPKAKWHKQNGRIHNFRNDTKHAESENHFSSNFWVETINIVIYILN
jgi:hypothetical protein